MRKVYGILGLGIYGSTIAKELGSHNANVIAIDRMIENVNRIEPYVSQAIQGDYTDYELLDNVGFKNVEVAVVASGDDLEASVVAIMHLKKLGVPEIISKAKNKLHLEIFYEMGATHVIRPEREMGLRLTKNLLRNNILDVIDLDQNTAILEFYPSRKWIGKNLKEIDFRNKYKLTIIGIKSDNQSINYNPSADAIIEQDTILIGIGEPDTFEHLDYTNKLR